MLSVGSQQRVTPLPPEAALAFGPVALAFGGRLLELSDEHLGRLRGVVGAGALLVLGTGVDLPWCDGIAYFGREPEEPSLLLPCASSPVLPATLLAQALERRFEEQSLRRPLLIGSRAGVSDLSGGACPLTHAIRQTRYRARKAEVTHQSGSGGGRGIWGLAWPRRVLPNVRHRAVTTSQRRN